MVSHNEIYPLVRCIWNLSSIHMQCVISMTPISNMPVKGTKGIASSLGAIELFMIRMGKKHPDLSNLASEIRTWLDFFEKEYGDPESTVFMKSINLTINHAKKLESDTVRWFETIYKIYEKSNTKLINENELREQIVTLAKKLDKMESDDLLDSYNCLVNNIPTPAVMMLYRIGESMVRKFYAKEMKKQPSVGATMGMMAQDLRKKQTDEIEKKIRTKADSLVNYIIVQTEERNLAQHPERRFDQTEAEEVFIFVKKLINDIDDRLKI